MISGTHIRRDIFAVFSQGEGNHSETASEESVSVDFTSMTLSTTSSCRYGVFPFDFLRVCVCLFMILSSIRHSDGRPSVQPYADYFQERLQILNQEKKMAVGGEMTLNSKEEMVNTILSARKTAEMNASLYSGKPYPPSIHFFNAKPLIDKSAVFEIIKKMPKGAALHLHDVSVLGLDWVVKNVTYREKCYMCYKESSRIQFKFSAEVPKDPNCSWRLVSDNRKLSGNSTMFDQWLYNNMSLVVEDPVSAYPSETKVWQAFEAALQCVIGLVTYAPVMRDYIHQSLIEFNEDNVQYLEVRALMLETYELDGSVNPPLFTLEMYRNVSRQFVLHQEGNFSGLKLIYSGQRRKSKADISYSIQNLLTWWKMFPDFLIGYDLVGQEDKGHPLIYFIHQLVNETTERKLPMPYFFHAGETNWQGTSVDENVIDAVLMNTTRIGHGFAIVKHPLVMEAVKQREITVEVNPISNQVLKLVDDLRNHPAAVFLAQGLRVVISSDDGSVWGAKGLSYDFYQAFMGLSGGKSDIRLLKQLARNSLEYSGMSQQEKKQALKLWESKWEKFIDGVLEEYRISQNRV